MHATYPAPINREWLGITRFFLLVSCSFVKTPIPSTWMQKSHYRNKFSNQLSHCKRAIIETISLINCHISRLSNKQCSGVGPYIQAFNTMLNKEDMMMYSMVTMYVLFSEHVNGQQDTQGMSHFENQIWGFLTHHWIQVSLLIQYTVCCPALGCGLLLLHLSKWQSQVKALLIVYLRDHFPYLEMHHPL